MKAVQVILNPHMPPVALGAPMRGLICGTAVKSASDSVAEGAVVMGVGTWSYYQRANADLAISKSVQPIDVGFAGQAGPSGAAEDAAGARRARIGQRGRESGASADPPSTAPQIGQLA